MSSITCKLFHCLGDATVRYSPAFCYLGDAALSYAICPLYAMQPTQYICKCSTKRGAKSVIYTASDLEMVPAAAAAAVRAYKTDYNCLVEGTHGRRCQWCSCRTSDATRNRSWRTCPVSPSSWHEFRTDRCSVNILHGPRRPY